MKKWIIGLLAVAAAAILVIVTGLPSLFGTGSPNPTPKPTSSSVDESKKVKVVTSTQVWADITNLLGGDWVEVVAIIPDNQDPHSYQATARDQLLINEADLVIANGGGYDEFVDQLVSAATTKAVFLKLVEGEHIHSDEPKDDHSESGEEAHAEEEHGHSDANEHIWFDFALTLEAAEHIAEAIAEIQPEAFKTTTEGYDFLTAELGNLELRLEALREKALGEGFIAAEGVANLMLFNAGFENLTPEELADAVEEEREVPLTALNRAKELLSGKVARILVVNLSTADDVSRQLIAAAEAGNVPIIRVAETAAATAESLGLEKLDYLDWMNLVLDQLQEAIY
jgi:zinc/manganese transport system substrate-binding protein